MVRGGRDARLTAAGTAALQLGIAQAEGVGDYGD
jgi:hypothetical protein